MDTQTTFMITIGIVYYRNEKALLNCLNSFILKYKKLDQLEFIIVNNDTRNLFPSKIKDYCQQINLRHVLLNNTSNNIASARNMIVKNSTQEFIYFTDPDCEQTADLALRFYDKFQELSVTTQIAAIGGGNRAPDEDIFHHVLNLLKNNFLGHFNSNQMKNFSRPLSIVHHLSTCNVLYSRNVLLKQDGFDERFAIVGEDLEFSLRLCTKKFQLIHLHDSDVLHYHDISLKSWVKKVFKYGLAQTKILYANSSILKTHRLLPLLIFGMLACLLIFSQQNILWAIGLTYLVVIFSLGILYSYQTRNWKIFYYYPAVVSSTHIFYFLGQCYGLLSIRTLLPVSKPRRSGGLE